MVNLLYSLFWIFLSLVLGRGIDSLFDVAIPTSILSMLLLLIFMLTGLCKAEKMSSACQILIKNIPLLIVPVSVGLMVQLDVLRSNLLILVVSVIGGTVITIVFLTYILKFMSKE